MPVLQGADLTTIDTEFKPRPEGLYTVRVESSELAKNNTQLRINSIIEAPEEYKGQKFVHFINVVQNDGQPNKYGLADVKRYMEAVFGKDSAEANATPPDTDLLNGSTVALYLTVGEYTKAGDSKPTPTQEVKKILPAG